MGTEARVPPRLRRRHRRRPPRFGPGMLVATILVAVASGCTTAAGGCAPLTLDDALSAGWLVEDGALLRPDYRAEAASNPWPEATPELVARLWMRLQRR